MCKCHGWKKQQQTNSVLGRVVVKQPCVFSMGCVCHLAVALCAAAGLMKRPISIDFKNSSKWCGEFSKISTLQQEISDLLEASFLTSFNLSFYLIRLWNSKNPTSKCRAWNRHCCKTVSNWELIDKWVARNIKRREFFFSVCITLIFLLECVKKILTKFHFTDITFKDLSLPDLWYHFEVSLASLILCV